MTAHQFCINSDGHPQWSTSCWRVILVDGQITVPSLIEDSPIDPQVGEETVRSIVADIIADREPYDLTLTALVRAAEEYRLAHSTAR